MVTIAIKLHAPMMNCLSSGLLAISEIKFPKCNFQRFLKISLHTVVLIDLGLSSLSNDPINICVFFLCSMHKFTKILLVSFFSKCMLVQTSLVFAEMVTYKTHVLYICFCVDDY